MNPTLAFLLLFISSALSAPTVSPGCRDDVFETCLVSLRKVIEKEEYAFAANRTNLYQSCSYLGEGFACMNDTIKLCFPPDLQPSFFGLVDDQLQAYDSLCQPGDTQERYLQHAECYRSIAMNDEKCASSYELITSISKAYLEGRISDEQYMTIFCCDSLAFMRCFNEYVEGTCGQEAANVVKPYIKLMNGSQQKICQNHTKEFSVCEVKSEDEQTTTSQERKSTAPSSGQQETSSRPPESTTAILHKETITEQTPPTAQQSS